MNKIFLDLGFVTITWYAFLITLGMIIGIFIALKEVKKHKINEELFIDYIFYVIIFGIIGARIWYVVFDFQNYIYNPLQIIAIWRGGLAIHGGLVGGLLYTIYYTKKYSINILILGDIAAPSLLLGQSIGRWGNFVNQEAHGGEVNKNFLSETLHLPNFIINGMNIDGTYYHPTFLYESIWNIIGFALIILVLRKKFRYNYGIIFAFYLMWYGFIRTLIEIMRTDALMFGNIKVAQVTSILMFIAGIIILSKKLLENKGVNNER